MKIRQGWLLLFLACTATTAAQTGHMTLGELIAALGERGYPIVYSDGLISAENSVPASSVSLDALREVLRPLGLELRQVPGAWVITRPPVGEPAPSPAAGAATPVLETVIVTGTLHRFPAGDTAASRSSYQAEDLKRLPALASDALRTTLRVPGVSSVGVSARPRIRGGLPDELLVIQDGVELLEPFHLADYHSAYSVIDTRSIESLDFYTGGFPSRYGNRMSGVMDIHQRSQEDEFDTDLGVSSFTNFIYHRDTFGAADAGSWQFSYRQGDLSDLTDYIETRSGEPRYQDAGLRGNFTLSPQLSLAAGLVYSEDDIVFDDEEESASSRVKLRYAWLAADMNPRPGLSGQLTLSWLGLDRKRSQRSFEEPDPEEDAPVDPEKGGFLDYRQDVQRVALRNDWSLWQDTWRWEAGWQADYGRADYRQHSQFNRGQLADVLGTTRAVNLQLQLQPAGWSGGAYLQAQWPLTPALTVQPSLRWDVQDYYRRGAADQQFSPRLGLDWALHEDARLRLSVGRFHQPEAINELQLLDGITEFFPTQASDQAVLGMEWSPGSASINVELYYKRYREQKGRFENIFNPFVLLPELEPDRVPLQPQRARALGLDVDTAVQFTPGLRGVLRYSYMDAQDRIDSRWIDRRWSQEHTVSAGLSWERDGLAIGLATTWHSGWRSSRLPAFVAEGDVIPVVDILNNVELRNYFSLDLGVSKTFHLGRTRLVVYTDISNLSDRRNQAGIDFDIIEVEGGYILPQDPETLLPRVVSLGATLSF